METLSLAWAGNGIVVDDEGLIRLQWEELQMHEELDKGKYAEGATPDRNLAFQHFRSELERQLRLFMDEIFARSLDQAMNDDAAILAEVINDEDQAQLDRAMALRIGQLDQCG